jgi:hypothetical protein
MDKEIEYLSQKLAEKWDVRGIFGISPTNAVRYSIESEVLQEYRAMLIKTDEYKRRMIELLEGHLK